MFHNVSQFTVIVFVLGFILGYLYHAHPYSTWRNRAPLILLLLGLAASSAQAQAKVTKPISGLTPGVVLTTDTSKLCRSGYTKTVRHPITRAEHIRIYKLYGLAPSAPGYVIDHFLPLELGGADVLNNKWPEEKVESVRKDKAENRTHSLVCNKLMTIRAAQAIFLKSHWASVR